MNSYQIFDDVFDLDFRQNIYSFFINSYYKLGWSDRNDFLPSSHKYLHSLYSEHDIEKCQFFYNIKNNDLLHSLKNKKIHKAVVNLSHSSNVFFPHSHGDMYSMIYYANIDWQSHWHGETIIYKHNAKDIETCVSYIPNRVLLLQKGIPHALRPPSVASPEYRITFACLLEDIK